MKTLAELNAHPPFLPGQVIVYKVGYSGRAGGVRHLLVSYQGGRPGTFRPDCNGNIDYRRVSTTGADTERVTCQRCLKSLASF